MMCRLGDYPETQHDSLMENNEASDSNQHQPEIATSDVLVSELIPAYLEYVRVEQVRPPITIERYRARLQRFIGETVSV